MVAEFCGDATRKPNTLEATQAKRQKHHILNDFYSHIPVTKHCCILSQFPELLYFVGKRVNEDNEDADMKEVFEVSAHPCSRSFICCADFFFVPLEVLRQEWRQLNLA